MTDCGHRPRADKDPPRGCPPAFTGGAEPADRSRSSDAKASPPSAPHATHAPHSAEVSTVAVSVEDSSSERSSCSQTGYERGYVEVIRWDELRLGYRLQPLRRYAHCREDVYLLSAFLELAELRDIDADSAKLLLRALKLLHLCDYSAEDLCSFLAHASAYFVDAYTLCGMHMDECEVGNVLVTLLFVAHCYVQDETCPLHVWHQYLFRKYCPLRTLNSAILRLLEIRRYILRLDDQELTTRYEFLQNAIRRSRVVEHMYISNEQKAQRHQAILSKVRGIRKYR